MRFNHFIHQKSKKLHRYNPRNLLTHVIVYVWTSCEIHQNSLLIFLSASLNLIDGIVELMTHLVPNSHLSASLNFSLDYVI